MITPRRTTHFLSPFNEKLATHFNISFVYKALESLWEETGQEAVSLDFSLFSALFISLYFPLTFSRPPLSKGYIEIFFFFFLWWPEFRKNLS